MAQRPYGTARWQRLRRLKLQINPLCEVCLKVGRLEVATAVDHIVAIAAGGDPFPALEGLMSCCAPCHNTKTRAEQLGKKFTPKGIKGCDVFGNPLDPNHDWYKT